MSGATLRVLVEQKDEPGVLLEEQLKARIAAGGETQVADVHQHLAGRKTSANFCHRVVGGSVIHHEHLEVHVPRREHRLEALDQGGALVERGNQDVNHWCDHRHGRGRQATRYVPVES